MKRPYATTALLVDGTPGFTGFANLVVTTFVTFAGFGSDSCDFNADLRGAFGAWGTFAAFFGYESQLLPTKRACQRTHLRLHRHRSLHQDRLLVGHLNVRRRLFFAAVLILKCSSGDGE